MTSTQTIAPAARFYIVTGGLTVKGPFGRFAEDCDPSTWVTTDDIRICGGGWFRTKARAEATMKALRDAGTWFTYIIPAASAAEAMNAFRAEEQARLVRVGLA